MSKVVKARSLLEHMLGRGVSTNLDSSNVKANYLYDKALDLFDPDSSSNIRQRNSVIKSINLLPDFASMITDEDSLQAYKNYSSNIIDNASAYADTAIYVPIVKMAQKNIENNHDTYQIAMEQGAAFLEDPNFIKDMKGWDDLENTVGKMHLEGGAIGESKDHGVFQVNDKTFSKYNPSEMPEEDMIKFAADIKYNRLPDSTVGDFNDNDGWNNWSTYEFQNDNYDLAVNKDDAWFIDNGLTQKQLNSIDDNFKEEDRQIARAIMWAESKGDHSVINVNKASGTTPKYQGNGTLLWLTEQSDKVTSILGRIENSSKGTRFRYNKAGNKYTDKEMIEKLTQHQNRISVALEASLGDGIITEDEAEFIMLGNLDVYQKGKAKAIKRIDSYYNKLDRLQGKLAEDIRDIGLKDNKFDFSEMAKNIGRQYENIQNETIMDEDGNPIENKQFLNTSYTATSKESLLKQLNDQVLTIYGQQEALKKSYLAWEGRPFREKVTVSDSEKKEYEKNIYSDMTITNDNPILTDKDNVQLKNEKNEKKEDKSVIKGKASKTNIDEKKYSNKRPDLFPTLKRRNGKFVFMDEKKLKEWDNTAYHDELKKQVPILDAGYDKYYWDNGWKHMEGGSPLGTATMSPKEYKKIISERKDLSKKQKEVFLKDMNKGWQWLKNNILKTGEIPSKGNAKIIG